MERELGHWNQYRSENGLRRDIEYDSYSKQWKLVTWRLEIDFPSGIRLEAFEAHRRGERGIHLRKIKYQLLTDEDELIFRIDCHGVAVPFDDCPHIDLPNGENRIEEGDFRLKQMSLRGLDFITMIKLVNEFLNTGRLPWSA